MPNRIIKESISKSEKITKLTDFQFRLWVHLITYVDDYGRGDARPAVIRGSAFPLRERITNKDIEKGLADLAGAGCVGLYEVDGKPYLYFPNWEKHQRVRTKVSKCPAPSDCNSLPQSAASCGNLPQNAARIQNPNPESRIQNPNPESRIQNPNPESESERALRAESDFEKFWNTYPIKAGKQKAKEVFMDLCVEVEVLLDAIEKQKKSAQWVKDNGKFIPHPAKWLSERRWEDELPADQSIPKGATGLGAAEIEAIQRVIQEGEQA